MHTDAVVALEDKRIAPLCPSVRRSSNEDCHGRRDDTVPYGHVRLTMRCQVVSTPVIVAVVAVTSRTRRPVTVCPGRSTVVASCPGMPSTRARHGGPTIPTRTNEGCGAAGANNA